MNLADVKPVPLGDTPGSPERILLKDFRPVSVFKTLETSITRAKYPAFDVHAHAWDLNTDIAALSRRMEAANIEKSIILSFETGPAFDAVVQQFKPYLEKFDLWCGFDYTGYDQQGSDWIAHAIAELERCHSLGAKGVGELGDKGLGEYYSRPVPGYQMHIDDERLSPLFERCGQLRMPVSIHVADPIWMYLPMDNTNDGMMNAYNWRIDHNRENLLGYDALLLSLEKVVQANPGTTFIACHLANSTHDLQRLGDMFDRYPNLYADISSRLKELGTVPRYAAAFFEQYQDRILFGSDLGYDPGKDLECVNTIYNMSFRLLESADDHIYDLSFSKFHWPLYGLNLPDHILRKLYRDNFLHLIS
jgi:uncharacterized protein